MASSWSADKSLLYCHRFIQQIFIDRCIWCKYYYVLWPRISAKNERYAYYYIIILFRRRADEEYHNLESNKNNIETHITRDRSHNIIHHIHCCSLDLYLYTICCNDMHESLIIYIGTRASNSKYLYSRDFRTEQISLW